MDAARAIPARRFPPLEDRRERTNGRAEGPYGNLEYDYTATGVMKMFEGTSFTLDELVPLRPKAQTDASGSEIASFDYDAAGRRVRKKRRILPVGRRGTT